MHLKPVHHQHEAHLQAACPYCFYDPTKSSPLGNGHGWYEVQTSQTNKLSSQLPTSVQRFRWNFLQCIQHHVNSHSTSSEQKANDKGCKPSPSVFSKPQNKSRGLIVGLRSVQHREIMFFIQVCIILICTDIKVYLPYSSLMKDLHNIALIQIDR